MVIFNSFLSNYQTVFDNPTWMVWCGFVWNSGVPTGSSSSSPSKWPEWEDSHFQIWTFHHLNLQILCSQNWMMGQFTGNPMVKTWSFRCRFPNKTTPLTPGLIWEYLQETMDFPIEYGAFWLKFSRLNHSIDWYFSYIGNNHPDWLSYFSEG